MKKTTSYQRRSGKLSPKNRLQIETHQHILRDEIQNAIEDLQKNFDRCVIEMGFGMGDHLQENFIKNPHDLYIGIDIYKPGFARLLSEIDSNQSQNCYLILQDATESIESIALNSVDRIDIHHPDPWPKKRHHKRRLINREFIVAALQRLKKSGHIHIITDDADYYADILEILSDKKSIQCTFKLENNREPNSKYGKKAQEEGRSINGIIIQKQKHTAH